MTTVPASARVAEAASPTGPSAPIRWRIALLNFVAVYPVITMLIYVIFPLTDDWAIWQRTLLLAPIVVTIIVYGISPQIQRHFGWFILPKPHKQEPLHGDRAGSGPGASPRVG